MQWASSQHPWSQPRPPVPSLSAWFSALAKSHRISPLNATALSRKLCSHCHVYKPCSAIDKCFCCNRPKRLWPVTHDLLHLALQFGPVDPTGSRCFPASARPWAGCTPYVGISLWSCRPPAQHIFFIYYLPKKLHAQPSSPIHALKPLVPQHDPRSQLRLAHVQPHGQIQTPMRDPHSSARAPTP